MLAVGALEEMHLSEVFSSYRELGFVWPVGRSAVPCANGPFPLGKQHPDDDEKYLFLRLPSQIFLL